MSALALETHRENMRLHHEKAKRALVQLRQDPHKSPTKMITLLWLSGVVWAVGFAFSSWSLAGTATGSQKFGNPVPRAALPRRPCAREPPAQPPPTPPLAHPCAPQGSCG